MDLVPANRPRFRFDPRTALPHEHAMRCLVVCLCFLPALLRAEEAVWWPDTTAAVLRAAGDNGRELESALRRAPPAQRDALRFLVESMPDPDRETLSADFLLRHVDAALAARSAPWMDRVPEDLFLNDVLPYASLNETRELIRPRMREIALPLVRECQTPGEAALALNRTLFAQVKVRYSTERKKPDQNPRETMDSGLATCSGLSILLVEACRSVGVPARVAGTPMWRNGSGNHTWVEIWDGDWHFVGAAEPDARGLDHAWFKGHAAQADARRALHRIYASSFRRTDRPFPLVWDLSINWVPAVDVTARYLPAAPAAPVGVNLLVRVLAAPDGPRVAAPVEITDVETGALVFAGTSRDETADLNHLLTATLHPGRRYRVSLPGTAVAQLLTTTAEAEQRLTLVRPGK